MLQCSEGTAALAGRYPRFGRWLAGVGAAIGWAALCLQCAVVVDFARRRGLEPIEAIVNFLSFFTVLSNILVALVLTQAALRPRSRGWLARPTVRAAAAVYIAMVAILYSLLLRRLWAPIGPQRLADHLLHDVMPPFYIAFWALFARKGTLRWVDPLLWLGYPALYFAAIQTRGALTGRYPYSFLDLGLLGWPELARNAGWLTAAFLAAGAACVALDRYLAKPPPRLPRAGERDGRLAEPH